jgi:hypothetical protein
METTRSTNEVLTDGAKIAEKWFTDANESMMEIYNKQLNLATDFYNKMFASVSGNNQDKTGNKTFADMFLNNGFSKILLFPFGNGISLFSNPFISGLDAIQAQMLAYNKDLLAALNQEFRRGLLSWSDIRQKYGKTLEGQLETSKKILTAFTEAGNDRVNFYAENYKKLTDEINGLISSMLEQNKEIWSDTVKSSLVSFDGEEKKDREPAQNNMKKKANAMV